MRKTAGAAPLASGQAAGRHPRDIMREALPPGDAGAPLLWDHLRRLASADGERIALVHAGERIGYAELGRRAEALAAALAASGVSRGDIVSYQLPNGVEAILVALAALRIGAVVNPIVPIYRRKEVSFIIDQARPRVIFAPAVHNGFDHARMMVELAGGGSVVVSCRGDAAGAVAFADFLARGGGAGAGLPDAEPDDDALLLYTSGTEGNPKGVRHCQRGLVFEARSVIAATDVGADDPIFMASPLTHITGFMYGSILSVVAGLRLCLMDGWDADRAAALIQAEGCTWTAGATPFLQGLLDPRLAGRIGTLGKFRCGGTDIPPRLIRDAQARGIRAMRTYGCTEHPTISGGVFDDPGKAATTDGRVHASNRVRIVDLADETVLLGPGEEGEIQSRGPEVFLGYRDGALDAGAFTPDGWLRTGDIGRLDADGYLTVVGRRKDIIIRKGENISAREVEDLLAELPQIDRVAVIGVPDAERGEMMVAVCTPAEGAPPTLADIVRHLERAGLARQKFPERLELVDGFPMNAAGKIRKADLRARFSSLVQKASA